MAGLKCDWKFQSAREAILRSAALNDTVGRVRSMCESQVEEEGEEERQQQYLLIGGGKLLMLVGGMA